MLSYSIDTACMLLHSVLYYTLLKICHPCIHLSLSPSVSRPRQDPSREAVTRINKETGELSASGELALPVQTAEKVEGTEGPRAPGPLQKALIKQLHDLRTHAGPGPDHTQQERLLEALALYRQVRNIETVCDVNLT